jgi:hypothetical protein
MATLEHVLKALQGKCGFEAVEVNHTAQLRIVARVAHPKNWALVMHQLKVLELDKPWSIDVSQLYFLRNASKKSGLVKAWRIILKAKDLDAAYKDILSAISKAPTAQFTVDEIPLPGGGVHRAYSGSTGKGAQLMSSAGGAPAMHLFRGN